MAPRKGKNSKKEEEEEKGATEMEKNEDSEVEEDESSEEEEGEIKEKDEESKTSDEESSEEEEEGEIKEKDEESESSDEESTEEEEDESRKRSSMSEEEEPLSRTPAKRPVRVKKPVDRYTGGSSSEKVSATKGVLIPEGRGTQLKDIPKVALKLLKRKPDDNLHLLHTILFGKKAKTNMLKRNIKKFSGFVWADNEEKQRAKLKEKLEKCVKRQLFGFCDVLDIKVSKSSSKKTELLEKLMEFLECPRETREVSFADKKQSPKGKKQTLKASVSTEPTSGEASAEGSAKKQKRSSEAKKKLKQSSKAEETVEDEDIAESTDASGHSDEDNDSHRVQKESKKGSGTKRTKTRSKAKKRVKKDTPKTKSNKSPSTSGAQVSTSERGKGKSVAIARADPSGPELYAAIKNIMKEEDWDIISIGDVLWTLGNLFGLDLKHRIEEVKSIILEVAKDATDDEEDGQDSDQENDEEEEESDRNSDS